MLDAEDPLVAEGLFGRFLACQHWNAPHLSAFS